MGKSNRELCNRCKRVKRKCICRKERNVGLVEMWSRDQGAVEGNRKKERQRKACRGKVRHDG